MSDEKIKKFETLSDMFSSLKKRYSKSSPELVYDPNKRFEVISTGNLMMDYCTGIGGFPRGRIVEIVAMESLGKSSLLYTMAGVVQKQGGKAIILDFEQALKKEFIENVLGAKIDQKTIIVVQPLCIEEGSAVLEHLANTNEGFDLLGIDSIEAMKPREIIEGSMENSVAIGLQARLVSQFFHKLRVLSFKKNCVAFSTNQLRTQISKGQFAPQGAGIATGFKHNDDKTTPGGLTPRFLASMRFELESKGNDRKEIISDLDGETFKSIESKKIKITNLKNKCGRPHLAALTHWDVMKDNALGGWNPVKDAWSTLVYNNIIAVQGRKYSFTDGTLSWNFSGSEENALLDFSSDPIRVEALKKAFKAVIGGNPSAIAKTSLDVYAPSAEAVVDGPGAGDEEALSDSEEGAA